MAIEFLLVQFEEAPATEIPSTIAPVRWARVNGLKTTLPAVLKQLEALGYEQVPVEAEVMDKE